SRHAPSAPVLPRSCHAYNVVGTATGSVVDASLLAALGCRWLAWTRALLLVAPPLLMMAVPLSLCAQGVTTGGITGVVRSVGGEEIDGASVDVRNRSSGYLVSTTTRGGRFFSLGLEVGGPYVVKVRRLGFAPATRDGIFLDLGEQRRLDIVLTPTAQR